MAVLLSGKPVAEHMCRDIRLRCEKLSRRGVTPTLGIVRVGRREEDIAYERAAGSAGRRCSGFPPGG